MFLVRLCRQPCQIEKKRIIKEELYLISPDPLGTFETIVHVHGAAAHEVSNRPIDLTLLPGRNDNEVVIDGLLVGLDSLQMCYRGVLDQYKTLLDKMMLGLDHRVDISKVYDVPSKRSAGFGMRTDADEKVDLDNKYSLTDHIDRDEALSRRFLVGEGGEWNAHAARDYLKTYDELQALLLVLIHLGSGLPARATELATYRLLNGSTSQRSVYFLDGQIFFMPLYSKTRNLTGSNKPIARFLSQSVTEMVLQDLFVVRPLVVAMGDFLCKNPNQVYNTELFVHNGTKSSPDYLRERFRRIFQETAGSSLSFSNYRQVIAWFARLHDLDISSGRGREEDDDESSYSETSNDIISRQMGHSTAVNARNYGRHANEHPSLPNALIKSFRLLSMEVFKLLLGIARTVPIQNPMPVALCASTVNEGLVVHAPDISSFFAPPIHPSLDLDFISWKDGRAAERILISLYGEGASFRSPQQRVAVEYSLFSDQELLVILPVGTGKTLVVELMAKRRPDELILMVVPHKSLVKNLTDRFTRLGISCSTDPIIARENVSVLISTPEAVTSTPEIQELLLYKCGTGRLGSVIIDEAHMFSIDFSYRPAYRHLSALTMYRRPIICLTATAPEWVVNDLKTNLYMGRKLKVIHQYSDFSNQVLGISMIATQHYLLQKLKNSFRALSPDERILIYVPSREGSDQLSAFLCSEGIPSTVFHAGRTESENLVSASDWEKTSYSALIATSAFGVGVHYENVKHVFMYGLPFSLIEFVQQSGRAGRNGSTAFVDLMFCPQTEKRRLAAMAEGLQKRLFAHFLAAVNEPNMCFKRILSTCLDGQETSCNSSVAEALDLCSVCASQNDAPSYLGLKRRNAIEFSLSAYGARSAQEIFYERLKELMESFTTNCIACFLFDGKESCGHEQSFNCVPESKTRCMACWKAGHRASECPEKRMLLTRIRGLEICPYCLLPRAAKGTVFHSDNEFGKPCCPFKNGEVLKHFYYHSGSNPNFFENDRSGILEIYKSFVCAIDG